MMKRMLLAMLMILCLSIPVARADITRDEARERLYEIMRETYGLAPEKLRESQFLRNEGGWIGSFVEIEHPTETDGVYVLQIDRDGKLTDATEPRRLTLMQQINTALQDCSYSPWEERETKGYERLAAFQEAWQPRLDTLADMAEIRGWTIEVETAMLALHARLPDEDALPYDAALEAARRELASLPGFSEEAAMLYTVFMDGYIQPEGFERPVWSFLFRSGWDNGDMLDAMFGGRQPVYISILLSAEDGTLAEPPMIERIPVRFGIYDMFARTQKVLRYFPKDAP